MNNYLFLNSNNKKEKNNNKKNNLKNLKNNTIKSLNDVEFFLCNLNKLNYYNKIIKLIKK